MPKSVYAAFLVSVFLFCSFAQAQVDFAGYWKLNDDKKSKSVADETGTNDGIVHGKVKFEKDGVNDDSDAIEIEDSGAYIEIPHHSDYLLKEGTVVFWIYPEKLSGRQGIFSKDSNKFDTGGHLTIYLDGHHLMARLQSTTTSYELKSKTDLKKKKWYHVAFVFGPGGMELYINGQLEKTNKYQGGFGSNSGGKGNLEPLVLGALSWMSDDKKATPLEGHFHGHIDEVAILKNRLKNTVIKDIFDRTGHDGDDDLGDFGESGPPPTYYVRKDGSDSNTGLSPDKAFKTIQHAVIQCSQPGVTVYVGPGTYKEEVDIGDLDDDKGSVTGTKDLPIRLIADITGEFTLQDPGEVILDGENKENMGFEIEFVEHWIIQGFTIRNQTEYGIYIKDGAASILNCTIEVPKKYAFYAESAGSITIADCVFERNQKSNHIIWIFPGPNITPTPAKIIVTRNDMTMKDELYMSTKHKDSPRSKYRRTTYGVILYTGWEAVPGAIIDEIQITNNQISDCYLALYANVMSSTSISKKVVMANNIVTGSYFSTYLVSNKKENVTLTNNIIETCHFGAFSLYENRSASFYADKIIENNIARQIGWRTFENKIIKAAPKFIDAPAGDFSLAPGSPGIDAGVNLNAPEIDIAGLLRPTDGNNDGIAQIDIGVSERINTGTPRRFKVVQWREIPGHR